MNLKEICYRWGLGKDIIIQEINQGFMNKTYLVQLEKQKFILRIYESENDIERVRREYQIVHLLNRLELSFEIPIFLMNQYGDYLFRTDQGVNAVLMPCLKGESPDLSNPHHAFEAGKALGELTINLGKLEKNLLKEGQNPSYEQYRSFHPTITNIVKVIDQLPTTLDKKLELHDLFVHLDAELEQNYRLLPKQFIHGDCTPGNLLFADGKITGILDFEFFCFDARAMDLAIALGGGPNALWELDSELNNIKMFTKGYLSHCRLTEEELLAIPYLIRLRRGAMFVYFCARYQKGLDDESWMRGIVDWVIECEKWLKENKFNLIEKIKEGLT